MKIEKFKHENLSPAGHLPNNGGVVETDGTVRIEALPENGKPWISIIAPMENRTVEGIRVVFDDYDEYLRFLHNGEIAGSHG